MPHGPLVELQSKIAKHAWEDPAFEAEFMANPKGTFEKYTGQSLPNEIQIHAHYNTPTELHFVVPKRLGGVDGELSDDDLDRVAGGEVVGVVTFLVVTAVMGALTASVTITANSEKPW